MMETSGKPFASYKKTILGQVAVIVWDALQRQAVDVILHGNPKKMEEDCVVHMWDSNSDMFFRRMNRNHLQKGILVPFTVKEDIEPEERTIEQSTDEELTEIIKLKNLAFVAKINKIDSVPVLFRMKLLAEELDRAGAVSALEKRISEIQTAEFISPKVAPAEEE